MRAAQSSIFGRLNRRLDELSTRSAHRVRYGSAQARENCTRAGTRESSRCDGGIAVARNGRPIDLLTGRGCLLDKQAGYASTPSRSWTIFVCEQLARSSPLPTFERPCCSGSRLPVMLTGLVSRLTSFGLQDFDRTLSSTNSSKGGEPDAHHNFACRLVGAIVVGGHACHPALDSLLTKAGSFWGCHSRESSSGGRVEATWMACGS